MEVAAMKGRLFIYILAAICFAGLHSAPQALGAEPRAVRIGIPISLSGRYDVLGTRGLQGARLWAEWANENGGISVKQLNKKLPVELIWYDDKSDKDTTMKLTEKLIAEDKVEFIIGPYGSSLNLAAAAVTERYGRILVSHAGATDKLWEQGFKYVIGVLTPGTYYYKSTMEMMAGLKPKPERIALITEDEPFNLSIADGIRKWAKELGFKIVYDEIYPAPPTDLSPILTKVKALNADAILASSHFRDGALLAKQAAEFKVNTNIFALGSAPSTVEWWSSLGPAGANYTIATSQWEPVDAPDPEKHANWYGPKLTGKGYDEWFKKRWGRPTDFRGVQSFAAGLDLQWAIERAGSLDTDKVRRALNDMDIMTFYGRSKIDPKTGIQVGHDMVATQWQDGQNVVVWPAALAKGKLIYPMPKR